MNYNEMFKSIGLSSETPAGYSDAEQFAKKFQRCSILTHDHVSYSNNTKDTLLDGYEQRNKNSEDQARYSKTMLSYQG